MRSRRDIIALFGAVGVSTFAGCNTFGSTTVTPPSDQTAILRPKQGTANEQFGDAVALSEDGTTAIIGANATPDDTGVPKGAAYVFDFNDDWTQQTVLAPRNGNAGMDFGKALALSADGTTAVIGAREDNTPNEPSSGSAYVYRKENGSWIAAEKIIPTDGDLDDYFGDAVTIAADGSTIAVGAFGHEDSTGPNAGSVYIFTSEEGGWVQQAKLLPDDGHSQAFFGKSLALSAEGQTLVIGADRAEDMTGRAVGSAYVFSKSNTSWRQIKKLTPDRLDNIAKFGWSTALSADGTTALIGAPLDDEPGGVHSGSVYVYKTIEGSWKQVTKLTSTDSDEFDKFGWSVALTDSGKGALISAVEDAPSDGERTGAVYAYTVADNSWRQQTTLTAANGDLGDRFGGAVDIAGNGPKGIIGAIFDQNQAAETIGAAYVYE